MLLTCQDLTRVQMVAMVKHTSLLCQSYWAQTRNVRLGWKCPTRRDRNEFLDKLAFLKRSPYPIVKLANFHHSGKPAMWHNMLCRYKKIMMLWLFTGVSDSITIFLYPQSMLHSIAGLPEWCLSPSTLVWMSFQLVSNITCPKIPRCTRKMLPKISQFLVGY